VFGTVGGVAQQDGRQLTRYFSRSRTIMAREEPDLTGAVSSSYEAVLFCFFLLLVSSSSDSKRSAEVHELQRGPGKPQMDESTMSSPTFAEAERELEKNPLRGLSKELPPAGSGKSKRDTLGHESPPDIIAFGWLQYLK